MEVMHHNLFQIQYHSVKRRLILFPVLLILLMHTAFAEKFILKGIATDFKNAEITLYRYADYISFLDEDLASVTIDAKGEFELEFELDRSCEAFLRVHGKEYMLFLELGESLDVSIGNGRSGLEFMHASNDEINTRIQNFNTEYNVITAKYYAFLVRGRNKALVDSVLTDLEGRYISKGREFINTYIKYKIALVRQMINKNKRKQFEKQYLISPKARSTHPTYMHFFNQYYPNQLLLLSMSLAGEQVQKDINVRKNYKGLMDALATNPGLKNDTLCELILIKGLSDIYQNQDYKKSMIIDMLDSIAHKTKIVYHKAIAANVKTVLTRLSKGAKAPMFTLLNNEGRSVSLKDFYGKYVYLDFWATWCIPCIKEMKLVQPLMEKYGDKIVFVSISTDRDTRTMSDYLTKNGYLNTEGKNQGVYLHGGTDKKIAKDYNIKTIPMYYLIDPRGMLMESPALRPSQNIEKTFYKIVNPREKKSGLIDPNE